MEYLVESLKETVATLEKQNSTLQDSLQRERETRRASRGSKTLDPQQLITQLATAPARTSVLLQTPPPTRTPHPSLRLSIPPTLPAEPTTDQLAAPESQETQKTQDTQKMQETQEVQENIQEPSEQKGDHPELQIELNTAQKLLGSLEDLLQQTDQQEVSAETLHWLTNDLGALQLEFYGAKSEIQAMTKQLENKDTRIAQLEAELKRQQEVESSLRANMETMAKESAAKEADLASRVYYLEEAAKVARQREVVRVVRPVEVKPPILSSISTSSATAFISSLFGPPTTDVPPANSLTHCFKQGFLTKQGSGIKTWKKRFAIVQANVLYYYTPDAKREPRGKFEMDNLCVVQEADEFTQKPLTIAIFHPLKQPFFCLAESQQDRIEWIEAFKAACTVVPMKDIDD